MPDRLTITNALQAVVNSEEGEYAVLFEHGSMQVGCYKPHEIDSQQAHVRDEIYVVQSGHGEFVLDGKKRTFEPGEVLFAPAGTAHRFENFSDDFSTWVVFYGPEGGE